MPIKLYSNWSVKIMLHPNKEYKVWKQKEKWKDTPLGKMKVINTQQDLETQLQVHDILEHIIELHSINSEGTYVTSKQEINTKCGKLVIEISSKPRRNEILKLSLVVVVTLILVFSLIYYYLY